MRTMTKVSALEQLIKIQKPLPKSWYIAAGLLRHKRKALQQHTQRVREEWSTGRV